jgi:hypothetical protein
VNPTDDRLRRRSRTVTIAGPVMIIALFAFLAGDSPPRVHDTPSIDFEPVPTCPADTWFFATADGWTCGKPAPPRREHFPTSPPSASDRATERTQLRAAS